MSHQRELNMLLLLYAECVPQPSKISLSLYVFTRYHSAARRHDSELETRYPITKEGTSIIASVARRQYAVKAYL